VKLAITIKNATSEAEMQRRQGIRVRRERELHAQARASLRRQISTGLRGAFIFLVGATVVGVILAHRTEIQSLATQKFSQVASQIKTKEAASPLRQSALNYEKEVDSITK
jgi:hypothetical protein